MKQDHSFVLAQEVERTLYKFSPTWEGIDAQETDLGDAVLKAQPGFAAIMRLRLYPPHINEHLDILIEQVENKVPRCLWIIGPGTQPVDLEERLIARGFSLSMEWKGLALDDLSTEIPCNPDVRFEPLSWENAEEYATSLANDSSHRASLLASAHRFLRMPHQEVQIVIARLDKAFAGYAVLRIEANGTAYLRNAKTVPALRHRGIYLSLVAHRLATAKAAGCTAAVVQALTTTSAPILIKRGFTPVCRIVGLARKHVNSPTRN